MLNLSFRKIAKISITNPARIRIGAMVIRRTFYETSSLLNTFGSGLFPPTIRISEATRAMPIGIQRQFYFAEERGIQE